MTWFIGIFTDILGTCGIVLGGIIVAILALVVIAFYIVAGLACVVIALGLLYAIYYWSRYLCYKSCGKAVPDEPFIIKFEEKIERFLKWMDGVQSKLDEKVARMKEERRQREWKS